MPIGTLSERRLFRQACYNVFLTTKKTPTLEQVKIELGKTGSLIENKTLLKMYKNYRASV